MSAANGASNTSNTSMLEALSWAADPIRFAAYLGFPKLDNWQKQLLTLPSSQNKVIIACGRQVGKTECVSWMATYQAFMHPDSLIICISKTLKQSHEMMLRIKNHLAKLPIQITKDSELSTTLANKSRILALPASTSNSRGFARASMLIIDEMAWIKEEDYLGTRAFLATVPNARLILLSTPHGARGEFHNIWANTEEPGWTRIHVTTEEVAAESGRITAEWLRNERIAQGENRYKMEYLAEFLDVEGMYVFPRELVMSAIDSTGTLKAYDFDLEDDVVQFTGYEGDEEDEDDEAETFKVRYHDEKQFRIEGDEDE